MNDKKNVKLLVLLLVVVLGAALAFGLVPEEDSQGRLYRVNSARSGMMQADPSDIVNGNDLTIIKPSIGVGYRDDLAIIPHVTDDLVIREDRMIPLPQR